MNAPDSAALVARVAELEAENAQLRAGGPVAATIASQPGRRGWSVVSASLIVIGLALGSISVLTAYAKNQLTDTELFVATFAPLAVDPEVQKVVVNSATAAIDEAVDIPSITAALFDGLSDLDLPPRAMSALELLPGPINQAMQSLVGEAVTGVVTSGAFADIWATTLRSTHTQLLAAMNNDADSALTISSSGALELQLGPIIAEVRSRLISNGVTFAEAIPSMERSIVIVEDSSLGWLPTAYALIVAVGTWLPWVALALLCAGVLRTRHRRRALIASAVAAGILMGVLGIARAIGRTVAVSLAQSDGAFTSAAANVIYDTVTAPAANTVLALGVLAIAIIVAAWLSGPARAARWVRSCTADAASAVRAAGDRHGVSTGATGNWIDRHHTLVIALIAIVGAAMILFIRPLSFTTVVLTVVASLFAVLIVEFLRLPDSVHPLEEQVNA